MGGDFVGKMMSGQPFDPTSSMGKIGNAAYGMTDVGQTAKKVGKGGDIYKRWSGARATGKQQQEGPYTPEGAPTQPSVFDLMGDLAQGQSSFPAVGGMDDLPKALSVAMKLLL